LYAVDTSLAFNFLSECLLNAGLYVVHNLMNLMMNWRSIPSKISISLIGKNMFKVTQMKDLTG